MATYINGGILQCFTNAQNFDNAGIIKTFIAGTSTPKATYPTIADALAQTNANGWPLPLNSKGEVIAAISGPTDVLYIPGDGSSGWQIKGLDASSQNVYDANGNPLLLFTSVANSANQITITNAATGNGPIISATGNDTNIDLNIISKGSGNLNLDAGVTGKIRLGHISTGNIQIGRNLEDINGNGLWDINPTASAINHLKYTNAATGNNPTTAVVSSGNTPDANVAWVLQGLGTKGVWVQGRADDSDSSAGYIGEKISNGGSQSITTGNTYNVTSISLTTGMWSLSGNAYITGTFTSGSLFVGISGTSLTFDKNNSYAKHDGNTNEMGAGVTHDFTVTAAQSPKTIYLVVAANFSGSATCAGSIRARRVG